MEPSSAILSLFPNNISDLFRENFTLIIAFSSIFFMIVILWVALFSMGMYLQEKKSMVKVTIFKVYAFNLTWMLGSFLLTLPALFYRIIRLTERSRESSHYFGGVLARFMHRMLFQPSIIEGMDNIPLETPCVFVANHQSTVDIAVLYAIRRKFVWVSKASVFAVPGVGQLMWLAGYVSLQRNSKESGKKMLEDCRKNCLNKGWSVIIFPQGTRRRHKILDFKMGAFRLAQEAKVPLIPVTVELPENLYKYWCKDRPRLIIHKPIMPDEPIFENTEKLLKQCFETVIGGLTYGQEMLAKQQSSDSKKEK